MKVGPAGSGMITMRCIGQSVGTETELRNRLRPLVSMETPSRPLSIRSLSFLDAVRNFAGPLDYESVYMKAKSDYVLAPLSTNAIQAMMAATAAATGIVLLCDAYGGKIADMAADATAFPRRAGTQYCIQYYASWLNAPPLRPSGAGRQRLCRDAALHGRCVLCELLRSRFAQLCARLLGGNLARLVAVKQHYDPSNVFHHAQSVPLQMPPSA